MSMDTLLTLDLNSDSDELIEVTLSEMRYHAIIFQKELSEQKIFDKKMNQYISGIKSSNSIQRRQN